MTAPQFAAKGYIFTGWYTAAEGGEKVTALVNALKTDAVKAYIESSYNGAVVAIF